MLRALKRRINSIQDVLSSQMHRPMLRALKRVKQLNMIDAIKSDASPDVEGIETLGSVAKTMSCGQMHRPILRALKLHIGTPLINAVMSDASPDLEGIETYSL